ncbi:hypothetical protein SLS53_003788 [Cytospora paraplurivora]|uniref:GAT domain-containing protein n=1 Tax=Cytospora paraplurivora TaxID=2898453 RepID=A0AAN9U8U1_9PEZI
MKSMKGLSNKMLGSIKKRTNDSSADKDYVSADRSDPALPVTVDVQGDTPEAVAARSVRAFCESGGPDNTGEEVTFLPPIVESAESSPAAAAQCAKTIRRYLKKDYWGKPSYQYNALMLVRILADNPGPSFTRNLDGKFADTVKELLRNGYDLNVKQMLMEMLDAFEHQKGWDEGLAPLITLWRREKDKAYKAYGGQPPPPPRPQDINAPPTDPHSQNYFARSHSNKRLPEPAELANRLEEARTSANLLTQLVANTPSTELLDNDLVKEFADRCLSASRSIQGYMVAENPSPDNETMESLIDVNEELQQALNSQKRAMLSARKELGLGDRSQNPSPQPAPEVNGFSRPPLPGPSDSSSGAVPLAQKTSSDNGKGKARQEPYNYDYNEYVAPPSGPPPGHSEAGPSRSANVTPADEGRDPFRDPGFAASSTSSSGRGKAAATSEEPAYAQEPFHPGFQEPSRSYLGRQDSAMNKITMHGAGYGSSDHQDDGKEAAEPDRYYYSAVGGSSSNSRPQDVAELDDDDDIYGAPPADSYGGSSSGKKPVYRY